MTDEKDFEIKEEFRSEVWNALEKVAFKFQNKANDLQFHQECMEQAVEWFMVHFYDC